MLRKKPLKRGKSSLKRSSIKKISDQKKAERSIIHAEKEHSAPNAMFDIFEEIWKERPHVCYETGEFLGNEPLTIFFHHILEKSKYPQYKLVKENIVLLSWRSHDQVRIDLDKLPKTKALTQEIMNRHKTGVLLP